MGSSNKKTQKMTNKPILKNAKMNINQLTTSNYINSPPIGQKKTNPFEAKPKPSEAGSFEALAKKDGEGGSSSLRTPDFSQRCFMRTKQTNLYLQKPILPT
jgi:hypothetical protein